MFNDVGVSEHVCRCICICAMLLQRDTYIHKYTHTHHISIIRRRFVPGASYVGCISLNKSMMCAKQRCILLGQCHKALYGLA